jgi:hypothetical protein
MRPTISWGTQPSQDSPPQSANLTHPPHLMALLQVVLLVDTDGINPPRFRQLRVSQIGESFCEVPCDLPTFILPDANRHFILWRASCIEESIIRVACRLGLDE